MKNIVKKLMHIIGIIILICLLLLIMLSNSYFYPHYVDSMQNIKIRFMDCEYWEKNQIPENLNTSQKWKIITTIGECKIIEKKFFLLQNINDKNIFYHNLNYIHLKHRARFIGDQAKSYLEELTEKPKELKIIKDQEYTQFLKN